MTRTKNVQASSVDPENFYAMLTKYTIHYYLKECINSKSNIFETIGGINRFIYSLQISDNYKINKRNI